MLLCLVDYKLRIGKGMAWGGVHWSVLTIGSVFAMTIPVCLGEKTTQILDNLGKASFFLFCLHEPIIPYVRSLVCNVVGTGNWGYTLTVVAVVLVCLLTFKLMDKACPTVLAVLNGGR